MLRSGRRADLRLLVPALCLVAVAVVVPGVVAAPGGSDPKAPPRPS